LGDESGAFELCGSSAPFKLIRAELSLVQVGHHQVSEITRASSVMKSLHVSHSAMSLPLNLVLFLRIQITLRATAIA